MALQDNVFFADSAFTTTDGGGLVGSVDPANDELSTTYYGCSTSNYAESFTAYYGVIAKSTKALPVI